MALARWVSPIGVVLVVHFAICVVSAILALALAALRKPSALFLVSVIATIIFYRTSLFGFVLTTGTVFLFMLAVDRAARHRKDPARFRWRLSCAGILVLVAAFVLGRAWQFDSQSFSLGGVRWGLLALDMWLVLRLVTILWEVGSGRIALPTVFRYAFWVALPFTLLGPLLRYSQFEQQLTSLGQSSETRQSHSAKFIKRFALGLFQVLLGVLLTGLQASIASPGTSLSRLQKLLIAFSIAPWSFYLLWGGYYKLMESLAPSWGITLPQSFNRPFGRRNLSEFWANWNMSATSVFRDYLFFNRWGFARANVYVNTLIVFLMVGLWHGSNGYWILFGLMHGLGFCAYLWYSRNRSRFALLRRGLVDWQFRYTGPVATYLYVCSCWFLPPTILKLIR
jgi:D-alanyl-lipoteichoic acid acyltransferase DltB (MBOAT superfamily)